MLAFAEAQSRSFTVDDGKAHSTTVTIGHRGRTEAELLEGLAEGATVIVHPSNELTDGARVESE